MTERQLPQSIEAFCWTPENEATAKRMFLSGSNNPQIARVIGCRPEQVGSKAWKRGWRQLRSPAVAERLRREGALRGAKATSEAFSARRPVQAPPAAYNDADLISDAIASGKVTVVAPGYAAGLTRIEFATGAVGLPVTWGVQKNRRRA